MAKPIISPYPLFGPDKYAYLRTLIRYNSMKAGYDSTIYSAISPDYINPGDIGPQSKIKEHGSYEKYTSLITDPEIENLAFQIMIPVRVGLTAIICAEMLEWKTEKGIFVLSNEPIGWSYDKYSHEDGMETFQLPYSTVGINDDDKNSLAIDSVDYFFAPVLISNFLDLTDGVTIENLLLKEHEYRLIGKKRIDRNSSEIKKANFFQNQIKPPENSKRRFVIRVNMTILDGDKLKDQREDAIILEIYDKI